LKEVLPVILSAAKDLARGTERSFAAFRMTGIVEIVQDDRHR